MRCKCCNGTRFIAHQVVRMDVMVDEKNNFIGNLFGGAESHIYDAGTPYGPYTCTDCGAEYDELAEGELPTNMRQNADGKWSFNDGREVTVSHIEEATYVSVWDGGREIASPCRVDMVSHQIVKIDRVDLSDELDILEGCYVDIGSGRYPVVDEDEYEPGNQDTFWE